MTSDLGLAKAEILAGYSACLVKDGFIVARDKGSRLKPVLSILERQITRYGGLERLHTSVGTESSTHSRSGPETGPRARADAIATPRSGAGSLKAAGHYAFADKVVGLAAFRLAYMLGARVMWGELTSSLAVAEARKRGVTLEYDRLVPAIMNMSQDDLCPMERMASQAAGDLQFYRQIMEGSGKRDTHA